MTPQEIFNYKNKWMHNNGHSVKIHSDLALLGKEWCSRCLEPYQWTFIAHTDIYEDTFAFESLYHAQQFCQEFYDWII